MNFWSAGTVALLGAVAGLIVILCRPSLPWATILLAGFGMILLAGAAGEAVWYRPSPKQVVVMVDLSPSTRTAAYRNRATLENRIGQLLKDQAYRVEYFAETSGNVDGTAARLPDLPAERTVFSPPAAAAVVLFSDGRFELPEAAPPTYPVVDPALDETADASVADLQLRGGEATVIVKNDGAARTLTFSGVTGGSPATAPSGGIVLSRPVAAESPRVSARVSEGDSWPENDALSVSVPPPVLAERWWVGQTTPPGGWRGLAPTNLSSDTAAYLVPSIIVLDNVAAAELTDLQEQRLRQYVRDLGGGLVILGGNRAFAAGGYAGSELELLSPLASNPPEPTTHWMLLVDGSGSMSANVGGATKWKIATEAATRVLPHLPPDDLVSVGSFSEKLSWWAYGKSVRDVRQMALPPTDVVPHGPTNLQPALEQIALESDAALPKQLLVVSDADTQITNASALAERLKGRKIHLHLLAIGQGSALPDLRTVVERTGGTLVTQLDPRGWAAGVTKLMRGAAPKLLNEGRVAVRFLDELRGLPPREASPWNRVWLKPTATALAEFETAEHPAAAARWSSGEGQVAAAAFAPGAAALDSLVRLVERAPRDPRFHVAWRTGPEPRVVVNATDATGFINDLGLELELEPADASAPAGRHSIPQTGPGEYALAFSTPRVAMIATIRAAGRVIDRVALAQRYAPEFDHIGNDRATMEDLARRTGGEVVEPGRTRPIDFHWPPRAVSLSSLMAEGGALFIALGLIWWRLRPDASGGHRPPKR